MENKKFGLSAFSLKMIAIVCMTLDHTMVIWSGSFDPLLVSVLRSIGRFTFPIMVFLLTEGYVYTSNRVRYAGRLFLFAILSMLPFCMMDGKPWNVLFTLFVGLVLLMLKDDVADRFCEVDARIWTVVFLLLSAVISWFLKECDWGFAGILIIYAAGQISNRKVRAVLISLGLFAGAIFKVCVMQGVDSFTQYSMIFYSGLLVSFIPMLFYNGERGKSYGIISKYAFYAYYPAHIFVLCMIYLVSANGFSVFL